MILQFTKQVSPLINLFTFFLFFCATAISQQSIADIKNLPPGSVVTTTGTISTGDEYGLLRYMQDNNAGIALYSSSLGSTQPGDSIIVTGVLSKYQGELQISPVMSYNLIATGKVLSTFSSDDFASIADSTFSGRLVAVTCVGIQTCEATFAEGPYIVYDQFGHTSRLLVNDNIAPVGQTIPSTALVISGIWTSISGQYELLARAIADASEGSCFLIPPATVFFDSGQVKLTWQDIQAPIAAFSWGENSFDHETWSAGPEWTFAPTGIEAGKIYQGQLRQVNNDTLITYSPVVLFAASSIGPPIQVFFNHNVDNSYSDGSSPSGTIPSAIQTNVINLIDQVNSTLDIAVYNAGSTLIIDAIKRAVQRGVQVRYITDDETSNSVLEGITAFPVYYRDADGIMHNKFMIGDADDPAAAFVWTGSTNWTINQLTSDANHAYVIRDQALALNYRREFEEMWGANLAHNNSLVGESKFDNTAHFFHFNGIEIESYFSPSDEPDCHILEAITSADYQIQIGLLLLTSETLIDEIISLHHQGVDVRVILEDEESSQYAVDRLRDDGIPLAIHDPSSIFHHKYAVIDEGYPDSDPMVVTGSHNWTYSADHINDENTLIVHDQSFTNIFRQEFEARWKELVPSATADNALVSISIYPNPTQNGFYFKNQLDKSVVLTLFNANGSAIQQFRVAANDTGSCHWSPILPGGIYTIKATWPDHEAVTRLMILPH